MSCSFCYATYNSFDIGKQLPIEDVYIILSKLKQAGVMKVTFAGGEPMLYKDLSKAIIYAKKIGLVTSIITNGSRLSDYWLKTMKPYLDWIGLSVDSLSMLTNLKTGRVTKTGQLPDYYKLITLIRKHDYKLKINTVVNIHNQEETLSHFITKSGALRWKVFDTLRVEGQNEDQFNEIKSTKYQEFIERNKHEVLVAEPNDLMTGSYLLIDPKGRFYENWGSNNTKSDSLVTHSIEHCLSQIQLDRSKFLERGGVYNW